MNGSVKRLVAVMVLILIVAVLLLMVGCATTEQPLVAEVKTVNKPMPVVTHCIKEADVPTVPRTRFVKGGNIESNAAAASADVRALQLYADTADALLRQCASP